MVFGKVIAYLLGFVPKSKFIQYDGLLQLEFLVNVKISSESVIYRQIEFVFSIPLAKIGEIIS